MFVIEIWIAAAHPPGFNTLNIGSETGFQRVLEWFRDVYTIQECPIPDSRTESERIRTSSNITFLGREILRIRRVALYNFRDTFFPDLRAIFWTLGMLDKESKKTQKYKDTSK